VDRRLGLLVEAIGRLARATDRAEIHRIAVDAAIDVLGADAASIRVVSGGRLRTSASRGLAADPPDGAQGPDPAHDPDLAAAVGRGEPWTSEDLLARPGERPASTPDGDALRTAAVVALRHDDSLIALLTAWSASPRSWGSDDLELLARLADHAGIGVHNVVILERTEARAARLSVVQAASARMNRANTIASVGRAIVEELHRIIDYHNARVYLLEPLDDLVPIAFEGRIGAYEEVDMALLRTKLGQGFTGWAALHGEPLRIPDTRVDPRGINIPGTPVIDESMLVVPMRYDQGVIGVLTLSKLGIDQFSEDDLQLVSILADQAAAAVESARLVGRSETLAAELRRLLDLSAELAQSLEPREVGAVIARHLGVALGVDDCTVSLWDRQHDHVATIGAWPEVKTSQLELLYPLARFPETRRVLETRTAVVIDADDPAADKAEVENMREVGARTLAMIPLVAKGQAVGLVELNSVQKVSWDATRLGLAWTMANEAGMALENARLYDAARAQADRDPLTGFFNHRYLYERLGAELLRSHRSRQPVSLLMIDLDEFKLVNDTFGHQLGDQFLVRVADVVRQTLRGSDIPARYGGDEFAVILPDADPAAAAAAAERILEAVRDGPFDIAGGGSIPIGLSIGAATSPDDGRTAAQLVSSADARMYVAKAANHAAALGN
jgi:diguanylate cyclase (GGDEF)-like protein